MATTNTQKQLDINSLRPGRPVIQVAFAYAQAAEGDSTAHTFTTPFAKTPEVLGVVVVGAIAKALGATAIKALSSTGITITADKGTAAAATVYVTLQGNV